MNPKFTYHAVLHWMGPPCALSDIWDEPYVESMELNTPLYHAGDGDDKQFVAEAVREALEGVPLFQFLKPGAYVSCVAAGELNFYSYDTQDGTEHDMNVEIEWSHFYVLSDAEAKAVNDAEDFQGAGVDNENVIAPSSFKFT